MKQMEYKTFKKAKETLEKHVVEIVIGTVVGIGLWYAMGEIETPKKEEFTFTLQGTVTDEHYRPQGLPILGSREMYIFSMDTKFGNKQIDVYHRETLNLRKVDDLINPGARVEVKVDSDWNSDKGNELYHVLATDIHLLDPNLHGGRL